MRPFEVTMLLENRDYKHRDDYEICRQICYVLTQLQCKKPLEPKDILKFSWDEEPHSNEVTSKQRLEELKAIAHKFEQEYNEGKSD